MDTESIRKSFKPDKVKILFVGESPPASGRFFYTGSGMTTFTKKAFELFFARSFSHAAFLGFFQAQGCYLEDLTETPIDKMPRAERNKILAESVEPFSKRLKKYKPQAVVAVLKKIAPYVKTAVEVSGLGCPVFVLPFPGQGTQNEYTKGLVGIMKDHL